MTTIIIDADSKKVYSDSRATITHSKTHITLFPFKVTKENSQYYETGTEKIFNGVNFLVTGCGSYRDVLIVKNSLILGRKLPRRMKSNNTDVYAVFKHDDKRIKVVHYTNKVRKFLGLRIGSKLEAKEFLLGEGEKFQKITDGSGMRYAQGAMGAGASPLDAIITTSKLDKYTDDNVVWMEIPGYS